MVQVRKQAGVKFIFVTILLDAVGLGLLIPVLPDVLRRFGSDPAFVSRNFGYFISIYALMQFLASPVLGSLSDRFGRRPILLVSLLAAGLDYLFMAFAPGLGLLYLGRVISGLTGASQTVASSYMADISTDKDRSANFGMIGAAFGVGFIVGPLIGGAVSTWGFQAPFLAAAGLNVANFAYGLFVLPESLSLDRRRAVSLAGLNPFRSLLNILRPSPYLALVGVYFLFFLSGQVHPVNWALYTEMKFGWTPWQVGLSLTFVGASIALANVFVVRSLIPRLGEQRSLDLGLLIGALSFLLFSLASQGWMMYAIIAFFALSAVAGPALQSLITVHVPPDQQGELQGSLWSLGSLATVLAPLLFSGLFTKFTRSGAPIVFPGAAYLGAAVICAAALGLGRMGKKS
jgi:DHA1 family tetracycline resistance protein-like MFS transporter